MNVLVTTSRMPVAIDLIRKLARQGHRVVASDTFAAAPGSHSRYVAAARVTASPRNDPGRFVDDVERIVREERIDLVLPAFEEAFYLAKHGDRIAPLARLFAPDFPTLARLHHKATFLGLARELGLRAPRTAVARSAVELRRAIAEFPEFFARPAYSRGGVDLLTNTGPLAGSLDVDDCHPTSEQPWLVQEFVHGLDVCTCTVAHHGRITGHAAYVHPREIEHAGGIVFESVREPECLDAARKIVEATGYHGMVSFDFMKTPQGMVLIECNPRPTAGVHVMSPELLEAALLDEEGRELREAEAGVRCKYSIALVRDMVLHWEEIPADLEQLFSNAKEVVAEPGDLLPALYQVLSYRHVVSYRRELHLDRRSAKDLMAAYFHDVCWNGEAIA